MVTLLPDIDQRAANRRRVAKRGTPKIVPLRPPVFIAIFLICFVFSTIAAQFTSSVNLVEVYATVTDDQGAAVRGLTRDDFIVEENGVPKSIEAFSSGDVPLSLALAVDHSFSVSRPQLTDIVHAMQRLLGALQPEDRVAVIGVGSTVDVLAPLSVDHRPAYDALNGIEPWGTTPLFDATLHAIDVVQQGSGRRALILASDGVERYSTATESDVVKYAREHDVLVYPIALRRVQPPVFVALAGATGARSFAVVDASRLDVTLMAIAQELRQQYLLGYAPVRTEVPGWRSITVKVKRPRLRVRARDGYLVH
jgi:Ca-activated chloride channel family protein